MSTQLMMMFAALGTALTGIVISLIALYKSSAFKTHDSNLPDGTYKMRKIGPGLYEIEDLGE